MELCVAKTAGEGKVGGRGPGQGREALVWPQDLLRVLWPTARKVMIAPMPLEVADEPTLNEAHWPIASAIVAARLIAQTSEVVPPRIAADLVMEGAFIASKLDPELGDPGRWTLAPGPRGLQIARGDRQRAAVRRIAYTS